MTLVITQTLFNISSLCDKIRIIPIYPPPHSKKKEKKTFKNKIRVIKHSVFLALIMTLNNKLIV